MTSWPSDHGRFSLDHPTRPDVRATYGLIEDGQVVIEVGVIGSPLFRVTVTASTDVELYEAMELLFETGFFSRRDLLHALRWSEWFRPKQIHDEDVRRAATVLSHLRQLIHSSPTESFTHDRYQQHSRKRAAE